ncbi:MAG: type II toxin-antitoxin system HicB family antitoxin [Candidatus Jettenia sp. CY-1]|nr:MAG: type II toxin-antitoxin system HicB family antitoxin [Candidatus Jettenia sp. CY-1]
MKYKVNIKKTEEGYAVRVPGMPGCWSQGKTEEEALKNIKDAILHLLREMRLKVSYQPKLNGTMRP